MIKAIKIEGNESSVLSVDLKNILGCIDSGEEIYWSLLWIEAIAELTGPKSIIDLEDEINNSEKATIVTWQELLNLSTQITQAIELLIIGDAEPLNLRKYPSDHEMVLNCDYTIELIDSSYWIIHSKNESFLNNAFNELDGVEYINVE